MYNMVVLIIVAKGFQEDGEQFILGCDEDRGSSMRVTHITKSLSSHSCPTLAAKPKLIFLDTSKDTDLVEDQGSAVLTKGSLPNLNRDWSHHSPGNVSLQCILCNITSQLI